MPTATFTKFNSFAHELGKATHNLQSHVLKVALTNTAPVATNSLLTNITQIAASGGYVAGGFTLDSVTWTTASGVAKLSIADEEITATGAMGPFRYAVVYNDTATGDPLIGWADYGSAVTLANGEKFRLDFHEVDGVLTVT